MLDPNKVTIIPEAAAQVEEAEGFVHLTLLYSSFDTGEKTQAKLVWGASRSLADYMEGLPEETHWAVSINAAVIPSEAWATTFLQQEDWIVVVPVPEGGGQGSKGILRMVAMLALTFAAPMLAPAILGAGLAGTTIMMGVTVGQVFGAVVSLVGSMLINALLPPPKPKKLDEGDSSPTYGIDGVKNTQNENIPTPIVYGEYRVGGNIVNVHTITKEDHNQDLFIQLSISEGEIENISEIKINDQPSSYYRGVEVETRLGTDDQTVLGWFGDTISLVNRSIKLEDGWTLHDTTREVDKLRIDYMLPVGLFRVTDAGDIKGYGVEVAAEYRKVGDPEWIGFSQSRAWTELQDGDPAPDNATALRFHTQYPTPVQSATPTTSTAVVQVRLVGDTAWTTIYNVALTYPYNGNSDDPNWIVEPFGPTVTVDHQTAIGTSWEVQVIGATFLKQESYIPAYIRFEAKKKTTARFSIDTGVITEGFYEIRTRRITEEDDDDHFSVIHLQDVGEIVVDDVRYIHTAILGLKVILSDQLNGTPKTTALVRGKLINSYDSSGNVVDFAWSDNPAWISLDMMMSERYGAGYAANRFDYFMWKEWADFCDANSLKFNGVFDAETNFWEGLQDVFRVGRAQIIRIGTKFSLAIERAAEPVMMFGMGNIVKGSFKTTWLPMEDRANEIEITFNDSTAEYVRRTLRLTDQTILDTGRPARVASYTTPGVVFEEQAWNEAKLRLNMNAALKQSIEFEASLEAIACSVGDVVLVQHDIPQWGYAGRIEAGSTTTVINLDRPVPMNGDQDYRFLALYDTVELLTANIFSVGTASIMVPAGSDPGRVRRVIVGGVDYQVYGSAYSAPYVELVMDIPEALNAGQSATLYDTDVIVERDVIYDEGEASIITLDSALDDAPAAYSNWMFGPLTKVKKPFRVLSIEATAEYKRLLRCVEYNDTVYSTTGYVATPNYSDLSLVVSPPTIISLAETLYYIGTGIGTRLTVEWSKPVLGQYDGGELFVSTDNGPYESRGRTTQQRTSLTIDVITGEVLRMFVVARDASGRQSVDPNNVIRVYTVLGKAAPPANVIDFTVTKATGGLIMRWTPNSDIDILGYEIREGTSIGASTVLVTNLSATQFFTTKSTSGTYTFLIRAIDTTGHYSPTPTAVTLVLPAPAAVVGFDVVQGDGLLNFRWDANTDTDISRYEVREGLTWATATFLASVAATSLQRPVGAPGDRVFWIKAIDTAGIRSDTAVFTTLTVVDPVNRNLVITQDETDWLAHKINVSEAGGRLQLDTGKQWGEYVWPVALPASYLARNVLETDLLSIQASNLIWDDATFIWSSVDAAFTWASEEGDLTSVSSRHEISTDTTLTANQIEAFSLDNTLTGINLTAPESGSSPDYGATRFKEGLLRDDASAVSWILDVEGDEYAVSGWFSVNSVYAYVTLFTLVRSGGDLIVFYDPVREVFGVIDDDDNEVLTDVMVVETGAFYYITVGQTATSRYIMVGEPNSGVVVRNSDAYTAITGTLDAVEVALY